MKSPYVCISGVGSPKQEKPIARKFEESGLAELNRVVALGVEITPETFISRKENQYGRHWYPVCDDLPKVLKPNGDGARKIKPILQLNFGEFDFKHEDLHREMGFCLGALAKCSRWHPEGVQINNYPLHHKDPEIILKIARVARADTIIIQCCEEVTQECNPKKLAVRIGKLADKQLIDYVIFGSSDGRVPLNTEALLPFIDAAYEEAGDKIGVGLAGDLSAQTVSQVRPALKRYPSLSFNAEARLHKNGNSDKRLDLPKVGRFLFAIAHEIEMAV
jgi:hypothetical protein